MKTAQDLTLESLAKSFEGKTFEDDTLLYRFDRVEDGSFVFKSVPTPSGISTEKNYSVDNLANLRLEE